LKRAASNSKFEKTLHALESDLSQLRTTRASTGMIDHIVVDVYGEPTPLGHLASITTPNATTLSVTLYDKSTQAHVEKAIINSPIGLVPRASTDGFIITIPPMTQDTRKEVCKLAGKLGESAKIAARAVRHKALKRIRAATEFSEDDKKRAEKSLQATMDDINAKISIKVTSKEKEIMSSV
jgi:ribosome recycling factor